MTTNKKFLSLIAKFFPDAVFFQETKDRVLSLTIDDVPARDDACNSSTHEILKTLNQYQAKATFFVTTDHIKGSNIVKAMRQEGHEIGNHGTTDHRHAKLNAIEFQDEFKKAHGILSEDNQHSIQWFRPGQALYNQSMLETLKTTGKELGYRDKFALASMIPFDTRNFLDDPKFTLKNIKRFLFPGSIIVLHGGEKVQVNNTVEVLKELLPFLLENQYKLVTLSEMF